ncbi:HPr family phosphocarrier protein, partial [Peribacillus simplex]|uniref:HPr family phosphocarrier protein n=1 Tax=Peribacillus simplex TaxID=1478 RepID=UPI003CF47EE3
NYLEKHNDGADYLFATTDSNTAAPYIIKTKKAVMAIGGFSGSDPAITLTQFKKLVKEGKVKYFLTSGMGKGGNNDIVQWVEKNGKKVNAKSIMGLMSLAVSTGTEVTLIAEGDDEKEA